MRFGRILFHHDVDDIMGTTADADVGVEAGDGPPAAAGDATLPVDASAEASPAWAPNRDEWDDTRRELETLREYVASLQPDTQQWEPEQEQEPGGFQIDPFSDDFGTQLATLLQQQQQAFVAELRGELAPIVGTYQEQRLQEGAERAKDILTDIATREGEFDVDAARQLAEAFLPAERARFGQGPRAAEAALSKAAKMVRELERKAEERGAEKFKNQLGNLSNVTSEPSAAGTALVGVPDAIDEVDLAMRLVGGR